MNSNPFSPDFPVTWKFKTLKEILESPPPPAPPWKIRSLMADGCGTQVSSHPHGMKSYSWLQAMIESSLGLSVWGHFESIGIKRTLFLETEDPEWMVLQRAHAIARGLEIDLKDCEDCGFIAANLGPFDLVAMRDQICRLLDRYKPDVAVLSTLQGLLGGRDWKEQSHMQDVNALLVSLTHEYCPLTVITDSPWDPRKQRAAGTITQAANYQNLMHYEKHSSYIFAKLDSKMDESSQFRIRILTTGDGVNFRWVAGGRESIEQYIIEHPDDSPQAIADCLGITDRYVRMVRNNLKAIGAKDGSEQIRNKYDKFRIIKKPN